MSRLIVLRRARFARLRDVTGLSAGNLASHIEALERSGFVKTRDALFGTALGKAVEVTPEGDAAYRVYVSELEAALRQMRASAEGHGSYEPPVQPGRP